MTRVSLGQISCVHDHFFVDWKGVKPSLLYPKFKQILSISEYLGFWFFMCESESHSVVSDSLRPHGLYSPWNSPGQNTGVGSHSLLQGIFPTQGLNPGLPHCRWILYQLSHKGSPRILEWVAYPFSSGSSQPRNLTGVSFIAGRFFTNWAIREAPFYHPMFWIYLFIYLFIYIYK